jgi:hypothetical protein
MTEKKNKVEDGTGGWSTILLQGIFGGVQQMLTGMLENFKVGTEVFARKLAKHILLFIFCVWGLLFIFVGIARLLDRLYAWPGMGEVVVGVVILMVALLLYLFDRNDN